MNHNLLLTVRKNEDFTVTEFEKQHAKDSAEKQSQKEVLTILVKTEKAD